MGEGLGGGVGGGEVDVEMGVEEEEMMVGLGGEVVEGVGVGVGGGDVFEVEEVGGYDREKW